MLNIARVYIIFLLQYKLAAKNAIAPTHLLITRAGPCDDEPLTVSISELSITTQTYDSSLSGTLNISQDISDGWQVKITMQKCLDLRNIDSCDHFKSSIVVHNGCSDEDDDEQDYYSMLFHYVDPKLECPVQAGVYKIQNYPFFTEDNYLAVYESKISTSVFGYIYRLDGYSADRQKILCVEAFLQLIYIREHDWEQNTDIYEVTTEQPFSDEAKDEDKSEDDS